MLLPCVLVIKTTRRAAASAADTHSLLTPFPMSIKAVQSFQPGAFQSIESFHELGAGGGVRKKGEKEKGSKTTTKKENDLLSICAVVILKMLNWVNVYT